MNTDDTDNKKRYLCNSVAAQARLRAFPAGLLDRRFSAGKRADEFFSAVHPRLSKSA